MSGTVPDRLDTQVVEMIGRSRLVESLLRAGLEVAIPQRDHGIDLIVFDEGRRDGRKRFFALPLQMKASSTQQFSIAKAFARFPDLRICHVWNVNDSASVEIYVLTHEESVRVGERVGWAKTKSWNVHGAYSKRGIRPDIPLHTELQHFLIKEPSDWYRRLGLDD